MVQIGNHRYQARRRELPDAFTHDEWIATIDYWRNCCAYCGQTGKLTLDHYIPLSDPNCPGTVAHNIVPACGKCNTSKRNHPIDTWLVKKFGKEQAQEIAARIQAYFASL
jgi:5-methylcytosine-specific restriction endonuclease McrA